jgi:phosphatidylserine decarboxylase
MSSYRVAFTKKEETYSKVVNFKETCCIETVLLSSMLEKQQLLHVFLFGDGVLLVAAVSLSSLSSLSWFLASFCMSNTRFSTTYIKDDKNIPISKMIDNRCNRKAKGSNL